MLVSRPALEIENTYMLFAGREVRIARDVLLFHSQSQPPEISPPQFRNDKNL